MSDQEIKINLCYYDPENPNSNLDAYEDEDRPQPRNECGCDNCFYGRDKLAMQLIEAKRERNEAQDKYATEATEHMLAVNKLCGERDEARDAIVGWENKWKCAVDMAARAELELDELKYSLKIRAINESLRYSKDKNKNDNIISKPNPLKPFYKY